MTSQSLSGVANAEAHLPPCPPSTRTFNAIALSMCAAFAPACASGKLHVPKVPASIGVQAQPMKEILFAPPFALAVVEDAIVRVVGPTMTCTGTLVEDDLVLTSHHCLVERGQNGEFKKTLLSPSSIGVELGGDYLPWGSVRVKAVVAPPCGEAGGAGDLAVLVLSRKLVGLSVMTPRLDAPPRMGETLDPVGFGQCATTPEGIRRRPREGGPVRALTGETIELTASICPGDSGGPLLSRGSFEVVGVVSLSAMDGDDRTRSPSVVARVDAYRSVFSNARLIADGADPAELPPLTCTPEEKLETLKLPRRSK